jgi:hypothetical protein
MAMKMRKLKGINPYFVIVAALTLICLFGWRLVTDIYADDLIYIHKFVTTSNGCDQGPLVNNLSEAYQSVVVHFHGLNSRLSNIICIFFILLPRTVVNIIDAIVGSVFFFMLFKVVNVRFKTASINTLVVGTALFWMAFPWYENMTSTDFYINYVWSSVFVLLVVYLLRDSHKFSNLQLAAVTFFAMLAVWIHEAFGCALIAYTFFVWLLGAKIDKRSRFIIGLGMCVGLVILSCGYTTHKIGGMGSELVLLSIRYRLSTYLSQLWPLYFSIITTILLRLKVGKQQFKDYRVETIASFVAIIVSCLISIAVCQQARALWPAQLFSVVQTIRCVNALSNRQNGYSRVTKLLFGCAALLYALWIYELVSWQSKFTEESNGLIVAAEKASKPLVYFDITNDEDLPFYLMGMVKHQWQYDYNHFLANHTQNQDGLLILPTKYEGFPLDEVREPGSNRIYGSWPMFYSINDTTINRFDVIVGEPQKAVTPINRLLMMFTDKQVSQPFERVSFSPLIIEGKTVLLYTPIEVGRTVKYRKFVRIEE